MTEKLSTIGQQQPPTTTEIQAPKLGQEQRVLTG